MLFSPLINVKMPTTVGILTFMSRKNFMLSWVEHEKSSITSGTGLTVLSEEATLLGFASLLGKVDSYRKEFAPLGANSFL